MLKYFNVDYKSDSIDINFGNKLNTVVDLIKIGKIKKVKKSKTDLQIIEMFSDKHKLNWILILIYETILSSRENFGENEIAEFFPENIKIKNPVQQILKKI
ncbi:MAG: hypothetical protein H6613_02385 [Ignavibacteriales bacterium]|nr:hypothetical protein [Ignavibacteriales bacterium]